MNQDVGQDLVDWMNDQPTTMVNKYGVSLLTPEEAWGDGSLPMSHGLCQPIEVQWDFTDDVDGTSRQYEGDVALWGYSFVFDPIRPLEWTFLGSDCAQALLDARGDVAASEEGGVCNVGHELSFYRPGSDCRACVEETEGDFASCVDAGRCVDEGQVVASNDYANGDVGWYDVFYAYGPACAPGYTIEMLMMAVEKEDETVPDPFDHDAWAALCSPWWNEEAGDALWYCSGHSTDTVHDGEVLTQGVLGPTRYLRERGTDGTPWADRRFFARSIDFASGQHLATGWSGNPGTGVISMPPDYHDTNGDGVIDLGDENYGQQYVGYGLNPYELRPDGTDPDDVDDTFARDWLAASVLKTSTTINGVPITMYDHDRCADDGWIGPDADGAYRCATPEPPDLGWLNDGATWWIDADHTIPYVQATATIGSTGLPDPAVPGGIVVKVAASPLFAEDTFEACAGYPATFQPDYVDYEDVPDVYPVEGRQGGGTTSLTAETYRFGKDDLDLRVVLNTNWVRGHCPTDGAR